MNIVDARGFSCQRPVMMTEEEINKNTKEFVVLVDNRVAEKNVSDFAISKGYTVEHGREDRDFKLTMTK